MKDKLTAKKVAELCQIFLSSEFGKYYITQLSLQYNALHQEAEKHGLSLAQKAMCVERAAGVKLAIDFLQERARLLEGGHFDKKN